ncbi:MAG TPA: sodium:proton antiporter, partial [Methylomirabilota bacterium]
IFVTMIAPLVYLNAHGANLGVTKTWEFFWATGALSSFLDNAPTYLTFLALGQGLRLPADLVGVPEAILAAISVGAVAMGANSYIGNAPNFMVKAIAEAASVRMPSFLGYMAYSGAVLIPLFIVVTVLFFA